jgi:hypothetical protein
MVGNTNVSFEVSDHEFKMRPVNKVVIFSLATLSYTDRGAEYAKH